MNTSSLSYRKFRVITPDQLETLKGLYAILPASDPGCYDFHTDRMVTNVIIKCIERNAIPADYIDLWDEIEIEIDRIAGSAHGQHYLMLFETGAQIDAKRDRCNPVAVTMVSCDLVGGESQIYFHDSNTPHRVEHPVGTTVLYRNNPLRGMSRIDQGHRMVLVSLYNS